MPNRRYAASGKQVLCQGKHFADAVSDNEAIRIAASLNVTDQRAEDDDSSFIVVIPRSDAKRLQDAENILGELANVFEGYSRLHAAKGTPEGDEKSKRNTAFYLLIREFLGQGYCPHEHQVPLQRSNGITSLMCLGCGQSRMEFYSSQLEQGNDQSASAV